MITEAHKLPNSIQWHEGMLLTPQHFQQMSLRHEALLHYHAMMISPFMWGIRTLEYDKLLLVNGVFRILKLEAIMPDGLLVSLHQDDDQELQLDLTPYMEQVKLEPLTIHLSVPGHRLGTSSVDNDIARYESIDSEVIDENTGEGRVAIPRLRPKLSLIAAETSPSRYVSFPLVRVEFRDQMFILTDYISPVLDVPRQSAIGDICSMIARRLREKALYLSDEIRTRFYDMGPSAVLDSKGQIQSLVEALPFLEALLNPGVSHPYALYLSLCLIAGHVAALGRSMVPPMLATYNHNDLRTTFEMVRDYIFDMIEEGIWESHFSIRFYFQNDAFCIPFEEAWMNSPLLIGVRGINDITEREVVAWVNEALIGSESMIQSLRERRILGVSRERREEDDTYVAARGLILFTLGNDREYISPGELLQILNLTDKNNTVAEIFLFVQKERKQAGS